MRCGILMIHKNVPIESNFGKYGRKITVTSYAHLHTFLRTEVTSKLRGESPARQAHHPTHAKVIDPMQIWRKWRYLQTSNEDHILTEQKTSHH
jgi:hypothetical protein